MSYRFRCVPFAMVLLCLISIFFSSQAVFAQANTIFSEDFSSDAFPPKGWTLYGDGWYWSKAGSGDYNGSAVVDIRNQGKGLLITPSLDLSGFSKTDEVYVEFDVFLEQNEIFKKYGPDFLYLEVAREIVSKKGSSWEIENTLESYDNNDYTYYHESTDAISDPEVSPKVWRHIKAKVPSDYFIGDLHLAFQGGWTNGAANFAIDNFSITYLSFSKLDVNPTKLIDFGRWDVDTYSNTVSVKVTNQNPREFDLFNYQLVGANPEDFIIVQGPKSVPAAYYDKYDALVPGEAEIILQFRPSGPGGRGGALTFQTTADEPAEVAIPLTGTGLVPDIAATNTLFLGSRTKLGSTRIEYVKVTNSGVGSLIIDHNKTILSGYYPDQYKIVSFPKGAILAGQTDSIGIAFTATFEGSRPAVLTIVSNALTVAVDVQLRGVGILPRIQVTPTELHFDSTAIGDVACATINVYNPGTDTLAITNNFLSSKDADYIITKLSGPDTLIPPEKSRQVEVCFRPLRNGTRVARLRFTTNIPLTFDTPGIDTSAFDLNIQGVGVPFGALEIADVAGIDSALVGKEVCRIDSISNNGGSDIVVTGIAIAGGNANEFAISGLTFPVTVQPGQSIPFTVCGTPGARGQRSATAVISGSSNGKTIGASLPLSVVGQEACSNTDMTSVFGTTGIGMTDEQTVTITNCGDVSETYLVASTGSDYTVVSQPTGPVAPGGTTTFKVSYKPLTCGSSAGTLTVTPSVSTAIPITVNGSGIGSSFSVTGNSQVMAEDKQPKDITITVTNTGTLPMTLGTGTVSGPFTVVDQQPQGPIAAGSSAQVTVRYSPTQFNTTETGSLTFSGISPQECTPTVVQLSGMNQVSAGVKTVAEKNGYRLEQNYPNPFNPTTEIRFTVPTNSEVVKLVILDVKGEVVRTLINEKLQQGDHKITLDAKDLASGTYFYQLTSGQTTLIRSMMLVK